MNRPPVINPTFRLDDVQFKDLLDAIKSTTASTNARLETLESDVSVLNGDVETLTATKAERVGEITLEGVFTPLGGTGIYETI